MEGIGNFMIKRRKIARCTSSFNEQKIKEQHMKKDGISGLPDEILIAILSLLTLKEAACTSILSHRWRYLWRYITGSFNFDSKTLLRAPAEDGTSSPKLDEMHTCRFNFHSKTRMGVPAMDDEKRTTYVSWVSEVLKLHRGPCIDEMRISFDFDGQYPHDIYDWIKFALEKGVQRFELDVFGGVTPGHWHHFYHLPSMENFKFFFRTSHSHHVSQTIGSAAGFCSLRALRLVGVNIMGEVLENFLSNCPFLEQLGIVGTTYLVKLKIAGPSLKLKCLEISQCWHLENLEISAINLVSFTYWGKDIGVHFKNVPLLSELSIGGRFSTSFVSGSYKHSSYIPQIEKLKLAFYVQYHMLPKYCRELGNLKEVQIFFVGYVGDSFIGLTSVIKASPNLSKFSVRMHLGTLDREFTRSDQSAYINYVKEATKCHHQCLKVVEFVGFDGSSNTEVDFVLHILEVAASLEKIIIDPHSVYYPPKVDRMEVARKHARQLKTSLPATVELVIL